MSPEKEGPLDMAQAMHVIGVFRPLFSLGTTLPVTPKYGKITPSACKVYVQQRCRAQ